MGVGRRTALYDEGDVFESYRSRPLKPNVAMEEPAVLDALDDVRGARVVDLGCGEAALGRRLLEAGCRSYLGIDASAKMVRAARATLRGTAGEVREGEIERFRAPAASVDVVVSRLALHYVEDVAGVLAGCRRWLAPAGRMVFTVLHPVITSHDARASADEERTSWVVDDYFDPGPREQDWLGARAVWHHRTVEDYVEAFLSAGFTLTALRECAPRRERFADEAEFARRRRIPLFLLLAGARV